MKCVWKSPAQCLQLFKAVQHTNTMVNLLVDTDGLHIVAMDMSQTSLVRLELKAAAFESWECPRPLSIGLYTEALVTILQKAKSFSTLAWTTSGETTFSVTVANQDQTTEFRLRAIDIDEDQLDIPEMDDDVALQVSSSVLREWLDNILMTKADVRFQLTHLHCRCSSSSTELGTIIYQEPIDGQRIESLIVRAEVDITLSYQAAKSLLVFSKCGTSCFLGFSNMQPSRLKVTLGHGSSLCLFVAPNIVEVDD